MRTLLALPLIEWVLVDQSLFILPYAEHLSKVGRLFNHGSTRSPRTVDSHDFPLSPELRASVLPERVEGFLTLTHAHSELDKGEIQIHTITPPTSFRLLGPIR